MVERWNGTSWSVATTPAPSAGLGGYLNSVACASTTSCFAVGVNFTGTALTPLVERWNGTNWTLVTTPTPTGAFMSDLDAVACASTTSCMAVGSRTVGTVTKTLVERWNGTSWSIMASPNPSASTGTRLNAVACVSATSCFAVGSWESASGSKALSERWNGSAWSIVTTPKPTGALVSALDGVACASATSCFAVGSWRGTTVGDKTLAERWNGTAWALVTIPTPSGMLFGGLTGVACASTTSCFAVGSSNDTTLVERWNGTSWTISATPPTGTPSRGLTGVTCTSTTSCFAVGSIGDPESERRPLVERWNGTSWTFSPPPMDGSQSGLADVACASATSCFAVGSYNTISATKPLGERWNGTTWSTVAIPTPIGTTKNSLAGVACPSTTSCFAVGSSESTSGRESAGSKALVEHWNGTTWTIMASPTPTGTFLSSLSSVACASVTSCFAVGSWDSGSATTTLTEHWNGTSWTLVTTPKPTGAMGSSLNAIACASTTSCFAVGSWNSASATKTLAQRWNGTTWTVVPSPTPTGMFFGELTDLACATPTSCFAVGFAFGGPPLAMTPLVEHWNGTTWTLVSMPTPTGTAGNTLGGVTCTSASDCFAVGFRYKGTTIEPLVEHWDGTAWSVVATPTPTGTTGSGLIGVTCTSATSCFAVGASFANAYVFTLIERYA